jgi:maleylacetate reductase
MAIHFDHQTYAQRVVLAAGAARTRLAEEVDRLGGRRVLVIATDRERAVANDLVAALPVVGTFDQVRMHVPIEVAEQARARATEVGADLLVTIGGGSTTGTAKAVALSSGLPILAVPTTYAGSEATPVWGLTEQARKTTGTDVRVLPRVVVYDPELSASLPVDLTVASGLNALAHCVDSQWAPKADPINAALGLEGARALVRGLREVLADGAGLDGRTRLLYGAYLAGVSFASAGSGLHHKICHVLGGTWNLPHAQTHAVVLPYVLAFNGPSAPDANRRLAEVFAAEDALGGLEALYDDLDAPRSLGRLGLPESALPEAAALVVAAAPPDNPRPVTQDAMEGLLRRAWTGARPQRDPEGEPTGD